MEIVAETTSADVTSERIVNKSGRIVQGGVRRSRFPCFGEVEHRLGITGAVCDIDVDRARR